MAAQQLQARALKLVTSTQQDVDLLTSGQDTSAGLQGRVSASLSLLDRNIKDLMELISREMDADRRQQGKQLISKLKDDHAQLRSALDRFRRKEQQRLQEAREKQQLLETQHEASLTEQSTILTMEEHTVRQETSLNRSIGMVDDYIHMGQASLARLREQGISLKNAQRKILDVANTLGLSQNTIRWIERRSTEDKYIFWGGVVITLAIMYFTIRWLL